MIYLLEKWRESAEDAEWILLSNLNGRDNHKDKYEVHMLLLLRDFI